MTEIKTIIFDLGGVLIDWNPDYVYDTIFNKKEEKDYFFNHICTTDWNENQDAGYPISKATEERVALFPAYESEIRAFYGRWIEMLGDSIDDTVNILKTLLDFNNHKIYALTNWSHELFPIALERFEFLQWFEGIVVSGEEKMRKPFLEIYHLIMDRYNIEPGTSLFIDDNTRNIKAAASLGINGIIYQNTDQLKQELKENYNIIV